MNNSIYVVMMIGDEEDIVECTIRHWFEQGVDGIVVLLHRSNKETEQIVKTLSQTLNIYITKSSTLPYLQSQRITKLAHIAAEKFGATFIVPTDVDEFFIPFDKTKTIAQTLHSTLSKYEVVFSPLWNHFQTSLDNNQEINPFKRIAWRHSERAAIDTCAYRYNKNYTIAIGYHKIFDANMNVIPAYWSELTIRHFSYRSEEQFVKKIKKGSDAGIAESKLHHTSNMITMGNHWSEHREILDKFGENALRDVYRQNFIFANPVEKGLTYDPVPLQ